MKKIYILILVLLISIGTVTALAACKDDKNAEYTVTFIVDGEIAEKTVVCYPYIISEPYIETTDSYTLSVWYTNSEFTEFADFSKQIDGNTSFYAYTIARSELSYTVNYILDGKSYGETSVPYGQCADEIALIEDDYYYYSEWYLDGSVFDFSTPVTDNIELRAVSYAKTYCITFYAEEELVQTVTYSADNYSITEPTVPNKDYYSGAWSDYDLTFGDISVYAVYTPIVYTATFIVDNEQYAELIYTVLDGDDKFPSVPQKDGYAGEWSAMPDGGDTVINAVYTPIVYTLTFILDDKIIAVCNYTVENTEITVPDLTEIIGYTAYWDNIVFDLKDKTIYAHYDYTVYDEQSNVGEPQSDDGDTSDNSSDSSNSDSDNSDEDNNQAAAYSATFIADNKTVAVVTYSERENIDIPEVPEKNGYTGSWSSFTLDGDIIVYAVYTIVTYTATFIADFYVTEVYFTIDDKKLKEPDVLEKSGYTGVWDNYDLVYDNFTVNAVYTPITYTGAFIAESVKIATVYFTVEDSKIDEPEIPAKTGYTGEWESYCIVPDDITVNAVYTVTEYTVTFIAGSHITEVHFTINDDKLEEPKVPEKLGYTGEWESYKFEYKDFTVYAIYTSVFNTATLQVALSDNSYTVTGYSGSAATVVIPSVINGIPVTSISENAFLKNTYIENLIIEDGVKTIYKCAFQICTSLVCVILPTTLKSIEKSAFSGCTNLSEIELPESLESISMYAFYKCTSLKSIVIPSNCKTVSSRSFQECTTLESVTFSDGVISIEEKAFLNCYSLKYIDFGGTVESIGEYAFYVKDEYTNILTSLYIPSSVTTIESNAFQNRTALSEVIFEISIGWKLYNSSEDFPTALSSSYLSNTQTAAQYLKLYKAECIWKLEN